MVTRTLGRLRQITTVVARHGLAQYSEQRRGGRKARADKLVDPEASFTATARRFRSMLEELGPTFIKFGQILSTRGDLLPPGFAKELVDLQDQVVPMPAAEAKRTIEEALGAPVEKLFSRFDEQPLASASIAQVHRAVTLTGDEVAVKVQRPNIRAKMLGDLDILRYLAQLAEAIIEESGLVTPRCIVEEFESALLAELDFEREADNMRRFAEKLARSPTPRSYVVPRVYDELSAETVLTMEFVRGRRFSELTNPAERRAVAANIARASFEQLFQDGLFHADPHPGNAFILPDARIALIDFGSVGVLVVAVGLRDADSAARLLYRVGVPDAQVSLYRLRDACASLFDKYLSDRAMIANVQAAQLLRELFDLAARFRIRIPSEYALVARASITVEGIIRQLDPELDVLDVVKPYVKKLVDEQLALSELGDAAMRNLVRARSLMRDLPMAASQVLMDLEAGKLRLQVDNPKLDTIAKNIDALGVIVFMGLVACGLIVGSLVYLSRYEYRMFGIPVLPSVGLYLASMLFGSALGRYLLTPRLRKISVGRWLARRRRRAQ